MTDGPASQQQQQQPHEKLTPAPPLAPLHEASPLVHRPVGAESTNQESDHDSDKSHGAPGTPNKDHGRGHAYAGPQLMRHFSMDLFVDNERIERIKRFRFRLGPPLRKYAAPLSVLLLAVLLWMGRRPKPVPPLPVVVPIQLANEAMLDIGNGLQVWYRTWGNRRTGVPVLFVHGGPGNCIADYGHFNSHFFEADLYFVVEPDQRGTGKSHPSVRESCDAMGKYTDISIDKMSADFELLREALGIDKWLVFGGSWGSTLSLDYGERYPHRCLGIILRGVYLNTRPEFDAVFSRNPYLHNPKRLAEFDLWFDLAAKDALAQGEEELDPNDSERFFRVYERMIERCDREAIWNYMVFEHNLMEEDPDKLLDPRKIVEAKYPEAQSVAFFESRLFLHGTFEDPVDLLGSVRNLKSHRYLKAPVRTWICQGHRDEVCPEKYAGKLADALREAGIPTRARFIDAGHEATDPVMKECLKESLADFLDGMGSRQ